MGVWVKTAMTALAALALMAGPAAAQVPDPYARELAQKLTHAEVLLTENGYMRAAGPFAGGLMQQRAQSRNIMLRAGQDYRIVGVCDERCRDLDLRLFDPNGQLIAQDVLADAVPVIHVQPSFTGEHRMEVAMARCTGAPCWYAVNVYSR
jgi:hypothetical protein